MTVKVKISGAWRTVASDRLDVKVSGSWKPVQTGKVKVGGVWKTFYQRSDPVTYVFYASHGQTARRNSGGTFDWKTGTSGGTFSDNNGNFLNWGYNSGTFKNAPNFSVMNFKNTSNSATNGIQTTLANAVATRPVVKKLYLQGYVNTNQNWAKYSPEPLWIGVWDTTSNAGSGTADPTSRAQWSSAWAIIPFPGAHSNYGNSAYTNSNAVDYGDDALYPGEYLANHNTRSGADLVAERDQNGNLYSSPYGKNSLAKAQALVDALAAGKGWILSHTINTGTGSTGPTSVWSGWPTDVNGNSINPISGLSRWDPSFAFDESIYGSMHVSTVAITVELDYV